MTRNLYLGADINRPVEAALTAQAEGKTPQEILVALANATYVTRGIVDQTNFPVRAQLLAGEISRTEPRHHAWSAAHPGEGWTSGLSELVNDPTAAGFDHRIDMVFGRTSCGGPLGVDRGEVTGTDVADRDPATGLWPSDHGGVVLRLRGL